MGSLPSLHAGASILLAIAMFVGFASDKARVEIISLLTIGAIALGLYFFPLAGTAPADGLRLAFGGFGHPALITICALMVLGRGLVVTGALDPAARALNLVWQFNSQLGLLVTLMIAALTSMIINDTPVLVLLLPILVQLARSGGMPASKTLIPVNSAILIGGMATTIGTSTNLLVVSIATDLGMEPIGVFYYTEIVLIAALIALPYIWLVMPRLLPDNSRAVAQEQRRYCSTLRLDEAGPALGMDHAQLAAMLPADVKIDTPVQGRMQIGARLNLSGTIDSLEAAARTLSATLAPQWLITRLSREAAQSSQDLAQIEMTVAPDSRLIGLTLQTAGLEGIAVLGVHQARGLVHDTRESSAEAPLREGGCAACAIYGRKCTGFCPARWPAHSRRWQGNAAVEQGCAGYCHHGWRDRACQFRTDADCDFGTGRSGAHVRDRLCQIRSRGPGAFSPGDRAGGGFDCAWKARAC